jgi:hypothetical protein
MPVIYNPKRFGLLTPEQQKTKLSKDSEYEIAHLNLTADCQEGKVSKAEFDVQHAQQWKEYEDWAKAAGLYGEVSVDEQLIEAQTRLVETMGSVNTLRNELGMTPIKVLGL